MFFSVKEISKSFGGLQALNAVSFHVDSGEVVGVIGPNGAGKTTLFNVINGILKPDSGEITFLDEKLTGLAPNQVCQKGLGRTFQIAQPFKDLSVQDNVAVAAFCRTNSVDEARSKAAEVLTLCGLAAHMGMPARNLTAIDQRRLELAKAMATTPQLILLDEIMAGLTRAECDIAMDLIRAVMETGVTILMVEHVMKVVISLCDRIVVLKQGCVLAEGEPKTVMSNQEVIEAYLGKEVSHAFCQ